MPDLKRCKSTAASCDSENDFQCSAGGDVTQQAICIPYNLTCNGHPDCPEGSDELVEYCAVRSCRQGLFRCANNLCIDSALKCNTINNCGDYSDESGCPCDDEVGQFKCHRGPCIDRKFMCNSSPDCPDPI